MTRKLSEFWGETTEYDKKREVEMQRPKSWLKSVSAFANGNGGVLIFGIADDDTVMGITANAAELKRLVLRGKNSSFDSLTTDFDFKDYSFSKLRERYKEWDGTSMPEKSFESFGIVDEKGKLTNAGALLADNCLIRYSRLFCTRWNGLDKSGGQVDALDSAEYSGSLIILLNEGIGFVKRNMKILWKKKRDIASIPSTRRNPVLADIFGRLGYMERQGSGLNKICGAYERAANYEEGMEPKFYSDRVMFSLTLKNLNYKKEDVKEEALNRALNENEQKVLLLIWENPRITQNEIKEQLQLARSHIQKIMKSLSDNGMIERVGSRKTGYWEIKK